MSTFGAKLRYGLWFLKRGYFAHFFSLLIKVKKEFSKKEATDWCKKYAKPAKTHLQGLGIPMASLQAEFPELINYAKHQVAACPFIMAKAAPINVLYSLIKNIQPNNILECGVAYGWSTMAILKAAEGSQAHLWSVDMTYPGLGNEAYVGCAVPHELRKQWTLILKPEVYGIPEVLQGCGLLDFAFYDSDRSYKRRLHSYNVIWNHLRMGGFMVFNNVNQNLAFKEFCNMKGRKPMVFETKEGFAAILRK